MRDGVRAGDSASVAPELRGREVSLRAVGPIFDGAARLGVTAESLVRGTGHSIAKMRNRGERIAWTEFATLVENLGNQLSDEQLIALGGELVDNPIHRMVLLPGRLLFSLAEIYRWGARPDGPLAQLLSVQEMWVTDVDAHTLCFETRMKPGYACPRAFWYLRLGFLRSVSRAFGLGSADVTLTITPEGASFHVVLPKERGLIRRARRRASWLLATQDAAIALKQSNDDLYFRNLAMQREVEARKDAEAQLRDLNAELETRVRDRTTALERANRDLAAVNAELTTYSAAVAHDLQAPVRAIEGFSMALVGDHADQLDADAKQHLDRIIAASARISARIDALLSLTRITQQELRRQPIDLGRVARSIIDDLRAAHPDRNVEVTLGEGLETRADVVLVRALLENLLGNAWKFTKNRPHAHISLTRTESAPVEVFCVRDDGAGFEMARSIEIFMPFRRLHSAEQFEGTGVGLAIVDRIVRRHGGKISFRAAPDQGAAFSFTLRATADSSS